MDLNDIISFANSIGAHAGEREFPGGEEKVATIFAGEIELNGDVRGWKHAIFVSGKENHWIVGISQSAKTRLLSDREIKNALSGWVKNPSIDFFKEYENT